MKVAIMQPYFFPYIGYFQLINAVDVFVIYDDVNFIKKGWVNRNSILVNGERFLFNIPLQGLSQNKLINQINIEDNSTWKKNLLKTIYLSYMKAPFFSEVFPIIEKIITLEEKKLSNYIINSLKEICNYLLIETHFIISSDINKNNNLKGQDKIIAICKETKTDNYVNAIGGIDLYNRYAFIKQDISLSFLKSNHIFYKQFKNEFIPWLSIIDIMMFNSVEEIKNMLDKCELI